MDGGHDPDDISSMVGGELTNRAHCEMRCALNRRSTMKCRITKARWAIPERQPVLISSTWTSSKWGEVATPLIRE